MSKPVGVYLNTALIKTIWISSMSRHVSTDINAILLHKFYWSSYFINGCNLVLALISKPNH